EKVSERCWIYTALPRQVRSPIFEDTILFSPRARSGGSAARTSAVLSPQAGAAPAWCRRSVYRRCSSCNCRHSSSVAAAVGLRCPPLPPSASGGETPRVRDGNGSRRQQPLPSAGARTSAVPHVVRGNMHGDGAADLGARGAIDRPTIG